MSPWLQTTIFKVIPQYCLGKGYHECGFTVMAGETHFLKKKIGSHGKAFRLVSCKGQFGQEKSIIVLKIDQIDDN